MTITYCTL